MKKEYCNKCGRKLLYDNGEMFCPVHITDMTPVTNKHEMVKYFYNLSNKGD